MDGFSVTVKPIDQRPIELENVLTITTANGVVEFKIGTRTGSRVKAFVLRNIEGWETD